MSLMSQSLLMEAQRLRLDGELDASIDLLRTVVSQCNTDLTLNETKGPICDVGDITGVKFQRNQRRLRKLADYDIAVRKSTDDCDNQLKRKKISKIITTLQLRHVSAYQLALLLLQRCGRRHEITSSKVNAKFGCGDNQGDENEADELLWKLGFRLRLSKMAFGYPICECVFLRKYGCPLKSFGRSQATQNQREDNSKNNSAKNHAWPIFGPSPKYPDRTTLLVMDNILPPFIFKAVQHAYRPESHYWTEFYSRSKDGYSSFFHKNQNLQQELHHDKPNLFASHNIPLPPISNLDPHESPSSSSGSLPEHPPNQFSSLLQQVAIIIRHRLKGHFPKLKNSTSVEVWCHQRPPDAHHQLHYDMDEIRLWEYRTRECYRKNGSLQEDNICGHEGCNMSNGENKRHGKRKRKERIQESKENDSCDKVCDQQQYTDFPDRDKGERVSCPIVSCVLTINVPYTSVTCNVCGNCESGAPTLVCNRSILHHSPAAWAEDKLGGGDKVLHSQADLSTENTHGVGWLCYPRLNRLLAFEGSLLHGVIPGIPISQLSNSNDDGKYSDYSDDGASEGLVSGDVDAEVDFRRVTLMMGFWGKGVRLSPPEDSGSMTIGPNVPFPPLTLHTPSQKYGENAIEAGCAKLSWVDEFKPISIGEKAVDDAAEPHRTKLNSVVLVDPLWVPVSQKDLRLTETTFGQYHPDDAGLNPIRGRFFLKSLTPIEIDNEVLFTT